MDFTVYKVSNTVNAYLYVGCTTLKLENRLHEHILHACNPNNSKVGGVLLYQAIRAYGSDKFSIHALETGNGETHVMFARESYWIRKLGTAVPYGYNQRARLLSDEQVAILRYNPCNMSTTAYARVFKVSQTTALIAKNGRGSQYTSDPYAYITRAHLPANVVAYMRQFDTAPRIE